MVAEDITVHWCYLSAFTVTAPHPYTITTEEAYKWLDN